MRRKIIHLSFAFLLVASFFSIRDSSVLAAEDDITGIALEKEMRDLIERGIMAGYGEGEYRPGEDVTRGQFAALMTRAWNYLNRVSRNCKFSRCTNDSIAGEIYRASQAGIINGIETEHFGMNDQITREQTAQIIDNALDDYLKIERNEAPLNFTDVSN